MSITHLDSENDREKLKQLRVEHRMLDDQISQSIEERSADQFEVRRLKKRKLMLKDMINKLESTIIPDLNA